MKLSNEEEDDIIDYSEALKALKEAKKAIEDSEDKGGIIAPPKAKLKPDFDKPD